MNLLALCLFIYKWLIAVPFLIASTTLIGIPLTFVSLLGMGDWGSKTLAVLWAKANSRVLGMGVDIEGLEHLQSDRSYVVVANHWSQLDILLIYGYLPVELKWVMKQELRRVPILGAACAAMGHIIIDRSNTAQAIASIERASKRLVNGMCVVFSPRALARHREWYALLKKVLSNWLLTLGCLFYHSPYTALIKCYPPGRSTGGQGRPPSKSIRPLTPMG
jgi:1-acyl-sn-glycerol-3-phosphate acyltransferase